MYDIIILTNKMEFEYISNVMTRILFLCEWIIITVLENNSNILAYFEK